MKKIAIIIPETIYLNDRMFNSNQSFETGRESNGWKRCQDYLAESGYEAHTIDVFPDLKEVDWFVFFDFNIFWYKYIRKIGRGGRTVYAAFEPPVVDVNNSKKGLEELSKYFAYIMTWNDELIDNRRFFKFMPPYTFSVEKSRFSIGRDKFDEKKLLCNISGNKKSYEKDELYSERKRVIEYYDGRQDFGLYGKGWETESYKSYKGAVESKSKVYGEYKFALSLENTHNIKGYITEKILDCFCAGIVPIYAGASNCSEYIPDECYIHYDDFESLDELDKYISEMEFDEYRKYLNEIERYLASDKTNAFSFKRFAQTLITIIECGPRDVTGSFFVFRTKKRMKSLQKIIKRKLLKTWGNIGSGQSG